MAIHVLAMVPIIAAGSALFVYAYNIEEFFRVNLSYTPMAANTAAALVLLVLGVVNARPDYPFRRLMTMDSATGVTMRHLFPASIGFILLTGWLIQQGYQARYFSEVFALALFTAASVVGLSTLILWNARMLYEADVQREQAEEERRAVSQYARSLIEASLDPLVTISAEGKITDVNEATVQVTGMSREELIGTDFSDYFTEPEKAREGYQQVFAKGFVTDYPLTIRHRDGKLVEVLYNASVYKDLAGKVRGVFAAARDVTESKRIMHEFIETKNFLDNILQSSIKYSIIGKDLKHSIVSWNEGAKRNYGYLAEEILGKNSNILHTPEDIGSGAVEKLMATAYEKGIAEGDFERIRKDGSRFMANVVVTRRNDASGNPIGYLLMSSDISERKQADAERNRLLKIIEDASDYIGVSDMQGHLLYHNIAARRMLGLPDDADLSGMEIKDMHPEWAARLVMEEGINTLLKQNYWRSETALLHRDGHEIPVSQILRLHRDASGNPQFISTIMRDISESKRAEEALQQAKKAAEALAQSKSEFLANMSHEIRTPMNAIIGLSELALGLELPPKLRDYCTKIHTSSKALLSILNDILDYSKVEADQLELDSIEFSLEEVLENVANLFIVRAEEKGLELLFQIGRDVPPTLIGDPLRLGQVMINLVGNAVKFTEKGEIHIRIEQIAASPGQATLRFTVRDSGIGMMREQLARLFQAFTQADGSITRKYGGTGLGLTISKSLVEKMGGNIDVSSEFGEGSTFTFTLNFPVPLHAKITRAPTDLRGMHVLVVDDLDTSRNILTELLTQWGFRVSEAANGQEALALLEKGETEPVELVLLDWKMPELDGVEVARRVHRLANTHNIPHLPVIIMVTAYSKDELLKQACDVQIDAVLTKPVTASGLFDTIIRFQGGQVLEKAEDIQPDLRERLSAIQGAYILLVEDNEINQQVEREFLERSGMNVTVAENGEEALRLLENQLFDAVLMDLQMPVMDGLEATRRIRRDERFRDLPVIAMTAAVMAQDREACLAAGMNGHIAKPILPNELREMLLKHIKPRQQELKNAMRPIRATAPEVQLPDQLPGFELHNVLALLGGNQALLRKLLLQFAEQFSRSTELVANMIQEGKGQEAADYLHRIKGAAANLGAIAVQQAAADLEGQLSSGMPAEGMPAFEQALAQALIAIASLGGQVEEMAQAVSPEECEKCQWQRAEELAGQLQGLLEGNDFVPHELMSELKEALGCQFFRNKLTVLECQVDTFDYANALTTLTSLKCSCGHPLKG